MYEEYQLSQSLVGRTNARQMRNTRLTSVSFKYHKLWSKLAISTHILLYLLGISRAPAGYLCDMMSGTRNGERPGPAFESKRLFGGVGQGAGAGQRMAGFLMWNLIEMCRSKLFSRTAGWLSSQPNDCSPQHPPPLPHGCPLLFIFAPSIWCELWSMKPQLNATEDKKKRSF